MGDSVGRRRDRTAEPGFRPWDFIPGMAWDPGGAQGRGGSAPGPSFCGWSWVWRQSQASQGRGEGWGLLWDAVPSGRSLWVSCPHTEPAGTALLQQCQQGRQPSLGFSTPPLAGELTLGLKRAARTSPSPPASYRRPSSAAARGCAAAPSMHRKPRPMCPSSIHSLAAAPARAGPLNICPSVSLTPILGCFVSLLPSAPSQPGKDLPPSALHDASLPSPDAFPALPEPRAAPVAPPRRQMRDLGVLAPSGGSAWALPGALWW